MAKHGLMLYHKAASHRTNQQVNRLIDSKIGPALCLNFKRDCIKNCSCRLGKRCTNLSVISIDCERAPNLNDRK